MENCGEAWRSIRWCNDHHELAFFVKLIFLVPNLEPSAMANNRADQPPTGLEPVIHGSTLGSAAPHIAFDTEKEKVEQHSMLEAVQSNVTADNKDAQRANSVEALGIPDWEAKQKKLVRTLDMTLLPQLWILYLNNFLNRTNIA